MKRHIFYSIGLLVLGLQPLTADSDQAAGTVLQMPEEQLTANLRQTAMPELGEGQLAKILTRFYLEGLGGIKTWEKISSLKVTGQLKLKEQTLDLSAYQKKPELIKMTLRSNQRDLVLAYDGEFAWQDLPGSEPEAMPEKEARRFIHSAHFGNYLLYPFAEGKTIRYIDTVPVEGSICHQIRVTLDTGYQVDYFIDIRTYLETKVINTDLRNARTSSIVYNDYIREDGMPIARRVESYENGEWVSSLTLDDVKVNTGIIPWMFKMQP